MEHMSFMNEEQKNILLGLAKQSIRYGLDHGQLMTFDSTQYPVALNQKQAAFVTLKKQGVLRGCIGSLIAQRPLIDDVVHRAYSAAFEDPRFPKLEDVEWPQIDVSISVLSEPHLMQFDSEAHFLTQLQPGRDGIILVEGQKQSTFLPSVWQEIPEPEMFISRLKMKAGLPSNYWSETIKAYVYHAEYIG